MTATVPADQALERIPQGKVLIDGQWAPAAGGETFPVLGPADRRTLAQVARGRAADINAAVASARRTFEQAWSQVAPAERARMLFRISGLIRERKEELAVVEALDTGKPLRQARTDVDVAARYFEYYAGIADKVFGQTIPAQPGFLAYTLREPLGVTAHIIPWNYPIQIGSRTVAPSLAAGNCCVVKPAEEAPLTMLLLGQIALDAGLPPGVLNIVPGYGEEAGAPLAAHPDVDHISFTGSVEVGTLVMEAAARNVKPVTLELGGKSPNIVLADADLERALPIILNSIIQNAGQTCSAGSRLLVERSIHDRVVQAVAERMRQVRLGAPLDDPDLGPVISEAQWKRVLGYVDIAQREGARLVVGGGPPRDEALSQGFFVLPTLFDDVRPETRIAQEEVFGPVLATLTFKDVEEAVELANGTPYGLIAAVWTRDIQKAHHLARRIKAGQVFINTYGAGGGVELPFGGYRRSGFGREKGAEAVLGYTQVKTVSIYTG